MLIVTIAALVLAASFAGIAYRLVQEDRRRSEARVALLTAAIGGDVAVAGVPGRPLQVGFVAPAPEPAAPTRPSEVAARAETPVPDIVYLEDDTRQVRSFRSERETAAEIRHRPAPVVDALDVPLRQPAAPEAPASADPGVATRAAGLFADVPEPRAADSRGVIALGALLLVGALGLGYLWFGRPSTGGATTPTAAAVAQAPAVGGMPLELLSLSHERRGGRLTVRGLVRNPVSGSERPGVVASVMLLDQAGGFLGSGRSALEISRLRPGDETGFSVDLPWRADVRRYRVTFRAVDGALVPHDDHRGQRQ